ncbi:unnamed protein product [Adineta steineri]|uniref:Uncharacterized protein n=1 Tax=Adineta steineri TaxID=433720 RepID=A0A819PLS8_9BILA|nr:unnamed protein product [Adineta steineri]
MDCVIDASGTYGCPNFAGPGKLPAINERTLRMTASSLISYRVPNERDEYLAGKRILLIGKGHSAATSAVSLECKEITFATYRFNTDMKL